jgi:drug/metabolite transporter (DMT)-like permease
LDEVVTWATAIGGTLVLAGIYIASRAEFGTPKSAETQD